MVMDYLGRYTHRVAISNDRLVKLEGGKVTFRYRDRKDNDRIKLMTLDTSEFIRRFLLHILPDGFVKIRHYGILSNRSRDTKLGLCKRLLSVDCGYQGREKKSESWQDLLTRITGHDPRICPYCGKGRMALKEVLNPSALPLPP
jgi:RNA polymerase subunit RPABC4/transcription elongation factor Spt4